MYCDLLTDGGGWTVFQRRVNGTEDFYRGWDDYVMGFGNLDFEFWLGLDKIHRLTKVNTLLRVDLRDFNDNAGYAEYNRFSVLDSSINYQLLVSYSGGTAFDSLSRHSGHQFTTFDRDNDDSSNNCAVIYSGAWWYWDCFDSNLNTIYTPDPQSTFSGLQWLSFRPRGPLAFSEMKLRKTV